MFYKKVEGEYHDTKNKIVLAKEVEMKDIP